MKRIVSLFLSFIMVATLLPLNALAIELDEVVVEEPVEEITEPVYYEEDFAEQEAEKLGSYYSQTFEDWWKAQDKIPADRISFEYNEVFDETGAVEVSYDEASGCAIVRVKSADEESWKKIVAEAGTNGYNWLTCHIEEPEGATSGRSSNTNDEEWVLGFEQEYPSEDYLYGNVGAYVRIAISENTVTDNGAVAISFSYMDDNLFTCLAHSTPDGMVYEYLRYRVYIDCDESGILLPEGTVKAISGVDKDRITPASVDVLTAYKNGELDYMPVSGRITYTYTGNETTIDDIRNDIENSAYYIDTVITAPEGYVFESAEGWCTYKSETEVIIKANSNVRSENTITWVDYETGNRINEVFLVEIDFGLTTMDEQGLTPVPASRLNLDSSNIAILAKYGINVTYDETKGHLELTFDKDADVAAALAEGADITGVFNFIIDAPENAVKYGYTNSAMGSKTGWNISTNDRTWEEHRRVTGKTANYRGMPGLSAYNYGSKTLYSANNFLFDIMCVWWYDANDNLLSKEYIRVDMEPYSTIIENKIEWNITEDGTLVISGEGAIPDYGIDWNIADRWGYTDAPWREYADIVTALVIEEGITEIGSNAFRGMVNIEGTLSLPEGITRIGHTAFRGCSKLGGELVLPSTLKIVESSAFEHGGSYTGTLVIPEGMKSIGGAAFRDADYTEVIIPASVNYIEGYPFIFNENLERITVDENNPYFCSVNGVLYNKDKTNLIEFPEAITGKYTVLESVVTIVDSAFCRTNLDEIIVPASVKNIEGFGFGIDDIKIVFNGAPETFGNDVLAGGSNNTIYFMGGAPKNVVGANEEEPSFSEDVALYYVNDGSWAFDANGLWNGYKLQEVVIYEQKLPTTGYKYRGYCGDELNSGKNLVWFINYSGTLTIRGKGAMADFEQVEDGNGVWKSTAPWVEYADKIKAITIEKGITSIGSYAFYELTNVGGNCVVPEGVRRIGYGAFNRTPFNGTLTLPSTLNTIDGAAFYECTGIKGALVIPEGVTEIRMVTFRNLAITSISIPSTVKYIEAPAFFYCENLASYSVASGNENYCSEDGILFSKDKTVLIGYPSARTGTYTVPETVTELAGNCFSTTDLSKVIIHENVSEVNSFIFQKGKAEVVFEGAPEYIGNDILAYTGGKVYFLGGAPKEVVPANEENPSFNENVTIYYVDDGSWELDRGGRWNGYKVNAQYGFGDVNGDFEVNVKDVYYARLFAAKLFAPTELEFVSADVNGDGKINVIDANLIRKYVLKIIDKFPVEVNESETYTLGMGIAPIISTSDGRAQADVTAAIVVLDDEGKIVSAQLDTVQTRINFPGGVLQNLNDVDLRSKYQKKDDFGMIVASPLGKEWFEQADAFEKAIVGMTAEDIENIPLVNNNGHMVADDETIYAGCTIDITSFQEAIIKACNDEYAKEFSASDLSLGIGNFTTLEGTTEATSYSEGIASFNTVFTGAVYDSEDKILACLIDNSWLKVGFDTEGAITSVPTDFRTRKEMKDDFGMIVASPIGKEWYEQITAFENVIVGMTAKEVSEIKTINKNNHMVAEDETIYAVCTISIPAFQIGVAESRENLKFI